MKKDNNIENKNPINSNRRKLLSLAGAAVPAVLLSPLLSKAAPNTIIEAGSNVDTASYIIFQDSGTIYAKNGTTGKIDFQGTDASGVANNAIANADTGSIVKFKGIFAITSGITVGHPITLDFRGATFTTSANIKMLAINSTTAHIIGGSFTNSNVTPTNAALQFSSSRGSIYGTTVVGGLNGINIATIGGVSIRDCVAHDSYGNGILVQHSTLGQYTSEPVLIESCQLYNNLWSGVTTSRARYVAIRGCNLYSNTEEGISIKASEYINIESNYIHDNVLHGICPTIDEAHTVNSNHVRMVHNYFYANAMNGI